MSEVAFEGWAIVEIMGHRVRPGQVKDVEVAGGKMLQVNIPISETDFVTEFYGIQAIYSVRPCTEEIARDEAGYAYRDPRPVRPVDYKPRPALVEVDRDTSDDWDDIP